MEKNCIQNSIKSSISSHSKPRMRLLKCFVLQLSVIKAKHLRSLVQGIVQGVVRGFE